MNRPKKTTQPTAKQPPTVTSQILDLIDQSGLKLNALAKAAGVSQPILFRFFNGHHQSMTLRNADKLCAYFGVRLTTPRKAKPKATRDTVAATP
jgi:plasmid maintenance system antidote protein VapI